MFTSFSEFKFFQSFRIPVESRDDVRFMVEYEDDLNKFHYIDDAKHKKVIHFQQKNIFKSFLQNMFFTPFFYQINHDICQVKKLTPWNIQT